jgi:hypothetical protein
MKRSVEERDNFPEPKRNTKHIARSDETADSDIVCHPYGVKPWGNFMLVNDGVNLRESSLGTLQILNDETVLLVLSMISAHSLCLLAQVSKALYAFSHQSDLWRNLTLREFGGDFMYTGNWKDTYGVQKRGMAYSYHKPLKIDGFYSDVLYEPWIRACIDIDPSWLEVDNIDRRSNLSLEVVITEHFCRH